jgi:1-deoxy-D-xylulose-5-phosphate reductoisomerase
VAARFPERLTVTGLSAHANVTRLAEQVALFRPAHVVVSDPAAAAGFDRSCLPPGATFRVGAEAAAELAGGEDVDIVLNAIVGGAGLAPTLAALRPGRTLALANKESIVLAGELVTATAARVGARLLPIDSEHSGAFQCLGGVDTAGVRRHPDGVRRTVPPDRRAVAIVEPEQR